MVPCGTPDKTEQGSLQYLLITAIMHACMHALLKLFIYYTK